MKAQRLPAIIDGANNLSSSPEIFSNLLGNSLDYHFFGVRRDTGSGEFFIRCNSDATANYRDYHMRGRATAVNGAVPNSENEITICGQATSQPAFFMGSIKGNSTGERVIDLMYGGFTSSTEVLKKSGYWKDTTNELTSLEFGCTASATHDYDFYMYSVPSDKSQSNWEQVGDPLVWSSESSTKSFTGLDGNQDEQYRLVWSGGERLRLHLNGDSGSNYLRQHLRNNSGSIQATNTTDNEIELENDASCIINAVSGKKRLAIVSGSRVPTSAQQQDRASWYTDTITNITTIDCTPASSATGTATLYRKIKKDLSGSLPWELAADPVQISGDFSAGHVFDNLEGDKTTLFRLEFVGANTSGNIELRSQVNSDTSNINVEQLLKADTSTVSAAAATRTYIVNCKLQNGDQAYSKTIIYPRIGSSRPMLTECSYDENALEKLAHFYGESVTEMTSLKVFASTSNSITGTLKIWRLS